MTFELLTGVFWFFFCVIALLFVLALCWGIWWVRVVLNRAKVWEEFLTKEGFTKISHPKAINEESFLDSPTIRRRHYSVMDAWNSLVRTYPS